MKEVMNNAPDIAAITRHLEIAAKKGFSPETTQEAKKFQRNHEAQQKAIEIVR